MTMRRGHHTSGVLKAMGADEPDTAAESSQVEVKLIAESE
jgi:hypothetical protein